ncbi:MAG: hypothetical protein ACOYIT_08215 [Christensenellales bacterium]|jgi:hypothetical protein
MKNSKKFSVCIVVFLFLINIGIAAIAEPRVSHLRYSHIYDIIADLSIVGSTARCSGYVRPSSNTSSSKVVVKLQKQVNGLWKTIKSWSGNAVSGGRAQAGGEYTVNTGYKYRVVTKATVMNADGTVLEEATATSATQSY